MSDSLIFDVPGLPPLAADDRRAATLISDAKSVMKKSGFARVINEGVKLEIEFQARVASGFSDPIAIVSSVAIALEQAGVFDSRANIRELSYVRKTGAETRYSISVSRQGKPA